MKKLFSEKTVDSFESQILDEISSQPDIIVKTIRENEKTVEECVKRLKNSSKIYFTGSGSSYSAALFGEYLFSSYTPIPVTSSNSSSVQFRTENLDTNSVLIALSESGESSGTLEAVVRAKEKGVFVISIVNSKNSTIVKYSDLSIPMNCGPQLSPIATKSFTSQIAILYTIINKLVVEEIIPSFDQLSKQMKDFFTIQYEKSIQRIADAIKENKHIFIVGSGIHFSIAKEAETKFRDLNNIPAQVLSRDFFDRKDSFFAPGSFGIVLNPDDHTYSDTSAVLERIKQGGSTIIGISNKENELYDYWIPLPSTDEPLYPLLEIIPIQLLTVYIALNNKFESDSIVEEKILTEEQSSLSTQNIFKKSVNLESERSIFFISVANKKAYDNFEKTITKPVKTGSIPTNTEIKKHEDAHVWGLQYYGQNEQIWNKVKKNDVLFFYRNKHYICTAIVEDKEDNLVISNQLWGKSDSSLEQRGFLIYMLPEKTSFTSVKSSTINSLFGYVRSNWLTDSAQTFHPDDKRVQEVISKYGSLEHALEKHGISFSYQTLEETYKTQDKEFQEETFKNTELSAHTATDKWVIEDSLGYDVYAHSIYKFLTHRKTMPPLTINVQAPWGGGKTSIMRMIQKRLDPDGVTITTGKENRKISKEPTKLKQIISVLKDEEPKYNLTNSSFERFTIWFNPWKYQNTEQVWAGLAHSIITQFSERLSPDEREKFLLELNVKRAGKENPLRKIKKQIFSSWKEQIRKFIWTYLTGLAGSSIITFLGTLESYANILPIGQAGIIISILTGGGITGLQYKNTENKINEKPADSVLEEYVEIPNYSSKLGMIHHVHEDLQKVFESIQQKTKDSEEDVPIVIFIDDLDRCSPGKVAEVIEAINMFISAEFSNCIFVMGMDTQIVASALEKHYQDIIDKLPEYSKQISMGWKFMDKFVQLPVIISPPDTTSAQNYVNSLLIPDEGKTIEQKKASQYANQIQEEELKDMEDSDDVEKTVERLTDSDVNNKELSSEVRKQVSTKLQEYRIKKAEEKIDKASNDWSDQNPEVQYQVTKAAVDFSDNPREIKRFLNVLRFNEVMQEGRKELKLLTPEPDVLRRWIILTMKWPQVALWVQRGGSGIGYERSINGDRHLQLEKLEKNASRPMDEWTKILKELLQVDSTENIPWIRDENLKKFFERENREEGKKLSQVVGMGLY